MCVYIYVYMCVYICVYIYIKDPYIYMCVCVCVCMLFIRHPLESLGYIQTESEGMEEDITCKWKLKESASSNTHRRQNRLWRKSQETKKDTT